MSHETRVVYSVQPIELIRPFLSIQQESDVAIPKQQQECSSTIHVIKLP